MAGIKAFFRDKSKRTLFLLVVSGVALAFSFFRLAPLPVDAAWVAVVLCGAPILKGAAEGLIRSLDIKADLLVSLALIASLLLNEIFAAGEVAFIMMIGAWLEDRTAARARAGIERMVRLTPRTARVLRDGQEVIVPAEEVRAGEVLRVLAGETVAVDGVITAGQTSIDQSVMTGESLPADRSVGDEVYRGTVNQFGTFDMRATRVGEDSSLQRMIRLVESADAGRARIVRLADRWATWIVVIALASAVATWIITGEVLRAVTILVVFCPCALVLATPAAVMAGIGNATRYGILVREGGALERMAAVGRIAFDKTGTLTHGDPAVVAVESVGLPPDKLLYYTAAAEQRSEHPLGKAVAAHYRSASEAPLPAPEDFRMAAGRGVSAAVEGRAVLAGNAELLTENGIHIPGALEEKAERRRQEGCVIIYVAMDGRAAGFIALADTVRAEAAGVVAALSRAGVRTVLLTGDNRQTARHIARAVGIADVRAGCLPEDKMRAIAALEEAGERVAMVGDGVNDAPALKRAYVGIAMGGIGSDIAVDAADIALVGDDIKNLPHLLLLSRRTMGTIKLNLALSMALNFAAILMAMAGLLDPVLGALVHNAGSVAVVLNASLLHNWKARMGNGAQTHTVSTGEVGNT